MTRLFIFLTLGSLTVGCASSDKMNKSDQRIPASTSSTIKTGSVPTSLAVGEVWVNERAQTVCYMIARDNSYQDCVKVKNPKLSNIEVREVSSTFTKHEEWIDRYNRVTCTVIARDNCSINCHPDDF